MGKTHEAPPRSQTPHEKSRKGDLKLRTGNLNPEEAARLAAFDAVVKLRDEQWAAMTPEEKIEELKAWEQVMKSVNENRAGYRQVFVDE